ncbi:hypothetical protein SARC_04493 [Sphaeroforma arctica JP610]|uniref:GREB1-like circularly permuted SF2 helicase domain-containing protein n=1 Tax=Sphaeroforma arctica JP610 TaxID=667725 RepID=A0A0L0G339_9EUKA|nr:hypothetical protein SARC_04493 [Sphaeroforma arctica JP610]KNC83256.1 hypothetical protein SARC_04493 [Sphaeroforma arctica JP610]|eukprot:XP_014157158.1 hypothetical protein SARC_04493 [Sphaeroforma arctica JP610]
MAESDIDTADVPDNCDGSSSCVSMCESGAYEDVRTHQFHSEKSGVKSNPHPFLNQFVRENGKRGVRSKPFVVLYDETSCAIIAKDLEYVNDDTALKKALEKIITKQFNLYRDARGPEDVDGEVRLCDQKRYLTFQSEQERIATTTVKTDNTGVPDATPTSQQSTKIYSPKKKVARKLFESILSSIVIDEYTDFRFVILSPNRISIAGQTRDRLNHFVNDREGVQSNAKGKILYMPSDPETLPASNGGDTMMNLFKQVESHRHTLFLAIQDEYHWGVRKGGQVDSLWNAPFLLSNSPKNLLILHDSATAYNSEGQIPKGHFVRMFKRFRGDESGVLPPKEEQITDVKYVGLEQLKIYTASQAFITNKIGTLCAFGQDATKLFPAGDVAIMLDYCLALVHNAFIRDILPVNQITGAALFDPDVSKATRKKVGLLLSKDTKNLIAIRMLNVKSARYFASELGKLRRQLGMGNDFAIVVDEATCGVRIEGEDGTNENDVRLFWFRGKSIPSAKGMNMEEFGRLARDQNILLIVIDKRRMGDTFPPHFRVWDLRARYENKNSLIKTNFYQDAGRAMGWGTADKRRPELWVTKVAQFAIKGYTEEDKNPKKNITNCNKIDIFAIKRKRKAEEASNRVDDDTGIDGDGRPDTMSDDPDYDPNRQSSSRPRVEREKGKHRNDGRGGIDGDGGPDVPSEDPDYTSRKRKKKGKRKDAESKRMRPIILVKKRQSPAEPELMNSFYYKGVGVAYWFFSNAELARKYTNRYQEALRLPWPDPTSNILPPHLKAVCDHNEGYIQEFFEENEDDETIMIADLGSGIDKRLAKYYAKQKRERGIQVDSYDAGFSTNRKQPYHENRYNISNLSKTKDGTYDCSILSLSAVGQSPGIFIREALRITKKGGTVYFVEELRRLSQPVQDEKDFFTWLTDLNVQVMQVMGDESCYGPNGAKLSIKCLRIPTKSTWKTICSENPKVKVSWDNFKYADVDAVIKHAGDDLVGGGPAEKQHLKLL